MSDHLPVDLVTNILRRLPVAAILRFRTVCKPWRAVIDSPRFRKLQLEHSAATNKNAVLSILDGYQNCSLHFTPYIDGETCLDIRTAPSSSAAQIGFTLPGRYLTLSGSCNGLICLSHDDGCAGFLTLGNDNGRAIIINPATREWHVTPPIVPGSKLQYLTIFFGEHAGEYRCACGFGYDSVSDDYKVVKVNQSNVRNDFPCEVISYGVRSNSSVAIPFPYVLVHLQNIGVFVGGAIHWVVGGDDDPDIGSVIVGFDLGLNELREVPQPEYPNGRSFGLSIGELGKCLCVFANYKERFVEVWMMKEYGVKESWSMMFSVPHPGLCYDDEIRPLGFSMTGQEILLQLDQKRLAWYDLKNCAAEEITVHGLKNEFMETIVCFESLESLVSPDGKQHQEPRLQKRNKRDDFLSGGFKLKL